MNNNYIDSDNTDFETTGKFACAGIASIFLLILVIFAVVGLIAFKLAGIL